jgi:alanine racemase
MTGSRRSFLKLWAAAPALGLSPRAHAVEHSSFDPWVEIRPDHRRHNVAQIHRRAGGRKVLAVIKNNGYGLGVAAAAHAIAAEPAIAGFAVVKLHEAATLRDAGVRKPVLCMGPLGESDLEDAVALDIQPMVYTPVGTTLERIAARRGRPVSLHVCVDTGIGRVGVPYREAAALLRDLGRRRGVTIAGTMMTFTEDPDFDREQLRAFLDMVRPGTAPVTTGPTLAREDVWVATLPVGHADGLPRLAAKGGRVRINGQLFPIVATVSASHCIVELGPETRARIGDVATLFDWEDASRPEDLAASFGGSVYDRLMHLSPLLPPDPVLTLA